MLDSRGNRVLSKSFGGPQFALDLRTVAAGTYTLRVSSNEHLLHSKIVVKH
ncbi:MAG: T9SS type A sorting domain-containing protein [Flavobacteriales bacterium]|nr:T9SS type A sorting domain-containing protein [Flavobacteriales bacterium]